MKMYRLAFTLLLVSDVGIVLGVVYSRSSQGHTSFPHDIPLDASEIYAKSNFLTEIDYLEPFPGLLYLSLSYNQINQFPNLINVSTTLTRLYLYDNHLTTISPASYLDDLVALQKLYLRGNPLISIPDVPGPGNTLYVLNMAISNLQVFPHLPNLGRSLTNVLVYETNITAITHEDINVLPILDYLSLRDVAFESFPNLCRVHTSSRPEILELSMGNNQLVCADQSSVWALFATTIGHTAWTSSSVVHCSRPGEADIDLRDVDMATFLNKDVHTRRKFQMIHNPVEFYCYPDILRVIPSVRSKSECAALCVRDQECVMMAYQSADCVLAAARAGLEVDFRRYDHWYMTTTDT